MTKNKQTKEVLSFLQKNRLDSIVLGVGALSLIGAITGIVLHSITLSKSVPAKKILYKELVIKRDADFEAQKEAFTTKNEELIAKRDTDFEVQKTASKNTYGIIKDSNVTIEISENGECNYKIGNTQAITFNEFVAESIKQDYKLNSQIFIDELDEEIITQKILIKTNKLKFDIAGRAYDIWDEEYDRTNFNSVAYAKESFIEATIKRTAGITWSNSILKLKKLNTVKDKWTQHKFTFPNNKKEINKDDIKELSEPYKTFKSESLKTKNDNIEKLSEIDNTFESALISTEEGHYGDHANNVVNSSIGLGLAGVAFIVLSLVLTSTAFKLWKRIKKGGTKK